MKSIVINSVFLFLCMFFVQFPLSLQAQELQAMPQAEKLTQQEFMDMTEPVVRVVEQDPQTSFSFRVVPEWTEIGDDKLKNYVSQGRLYGDVAVFVGPLTSQGRARFEVTSEELTSALYLKHWVIDRIIKNGYTLISIEEKPDGRMEALYIIFKDGVTNVTRSLFKVNGKRILMATYMIPQDLYKQYKDQQILTLENFRFTENDREYAEDVKTYAYLDKRKFEYPQSLIVNSSDIISEDEFTIELLLRDQQNFIKGNFRVDIYARDQEDFDLKQKVADLLNAWDENKLERRDLIEKKKYDTNENITYQNIDVYGMSVKSSEYLKYEEDPITQELWLGILADEEYYYVVSLVGVARDIDIISWSRNARAYEMIIRSLRKSELL